MNSIATLYDIFLQHPNICTDTRKLKPGDIFFALKGDNFNGNAYALTALDNGAAYAITDEAISATPQQQAQIIQVADSLTALQELARYHRQQLAIPFIAITGSNGKTTTKELLAAVLNTTYKTQYTQGNLNNHIGVPLTILSIRPDCEMAITEMGANHQKEIESYCVIAEPTHGIINNIGKAHLEGFGGLEGVKKGKGELYDYLRATNGTIFLNDDLEYLKTMAKGAPHQISYGTHGSADYKFAVMSNTEFATIASLNKDTETTIQSHLVGAYNAPNMMAAVAIGLFFKVDIDHIKQAIEAYNPDNSRSQLIQKNGNDIILDAYNANPTSMKAAIENFAKNTADSKILWLGAMKELGTASQEEHVALVELIHTYPWQQVILVGPEFAHIATPYLWFENSVEAKNYMAQHPPTNAQILIKGSRGSKMEVLLEGL